MSATPEERLKLKRFGLILANCFMPGLGNGIFVDRKQFGIVAAFLLCQLVLQNPFPYFAFLIGSVAYGLMMINRSPQAVNLRLHMEETQRLSGLSEEERTRPNAPMGHTADPHFASDRFEEKQERVERILAQEAAIEEEMDRANARAPVDEAFDPTVPLSQSWGRVDEEEPAGKSWLQSQLEQALQSQTDPGTPILQPAAIEHDPWQQQQTDPALPVTGEHDPWQQQMTDPAAPRPVSGYASAFAGLGSIESTGSLLPDTPRTEVIGGLQASGMTNHLGSLTDPTIGSGLLATAPIGAASQAPATDPLSSVGNSVCGASTTPQSEKMTCHNCGYKRDHDFAFCPQCATFF
jgi:hypothetical protein